MKKTIIIILVSLLPLVANAYDACIDGIYYNFSESQATVIYRNYGYKSYSGDVVIPKTVTYNGKNYNVTRIGTYAFFQCSDLTSVTIPNSIISIGTYAFSGCSSLTYLSIPSSVNSIGNYAFYGCSKLTALNIGYGVTSIESHAFGLCESLKDVCCNADTIPSTSSEAFSETNVSQVILYIPWALEHDYRTTSPWNQFGRIVGISDNVLTTIGPQLENNSFEEWSIVNPTSNKALYQPWGEGKTPYWGTGNPGATTIGASNSTYKDEDGRRFANLSSKFIAVKFAAGNIFTGEYLETDGSNGVLSFGRPFTSFPTKMRFDYKYKTSPITKTGGDWKEPWGNYISKSMYEKLKGQPDSCHIYIALGDWEPQKYTYQYGEKAGQTIDVPYLIRTRPTAIHLFDLNDPHLIAYGSMTCGENITNWTTKAIDIQYRNKRTPKYIIVVASSSKYGGYFTGGEESLLQLDNIELLYKNDPEPDPTDSIPVNGGTFIAKLPNGVNMEFQVLNKKNKTCIVGSGLRCCIDQKTSEDIIIPDKVWGLNVVAIGRSAFDGCGNIKSVTIPESVTSIGYNAFYGCSSLTSITIPNSVTSIGSYTFKNCSSLISITIPSSVTSISSYTFSGCSRLTSITIPNSVTSIDEGAFSGCYSLTSVTLKSSAIVSTAYRSIKNIFGEQVTEYVIGDSIESISSYAFSECTNLKSIVIGSSVNYIGIYAFSGCLGLTSVAIPDGMKDIGGYAFYGCFNMSSITIPESVSSIGYYAIPTTTTIYTTVGKSLLALWKAGCLNIRENGSGRELAVPNLSLVKSTVNSLTMSFVNEYNELRETVKIQGEQVEKENNGYWIVLRGLDPNTQYHNVASLTLTCDSVSYTKNYSFRTSPLTLTTMQPKVVSEGNVIVSAETNLDIEETNIGFEWRRIDWSDDFDSKKGIAYLYEGIMEGYIRSLNSNYLWKYRPYYTSNSGKTYYGDWKGIDPSDYSYFEPSVHTYSTISVTGNRAEVKGYAMRGTDNVVSQGFIYWKKTSSYSLQKKASTIPSDVVTVEASGNVMTAVFENLDYETQYCYVAYVKTEENEMFFGEEQTFMTDEIDPDCIEGVMASEDAVEVARYDIQGRKIAKPQNGINIIRYFDGSTRKIIVK